MAGKKIGNFDEVDVTEVRVNNSLAVPPKIVNKLYSIAGQLFWAGSRLDSQTPDMSGYVQKVTGKNLSTNDYSNADKARLINTSGSNTGDQTLPTKLSDLSDDATHRVVSDTEKSTWNGKGSSNLVLGETSSTAYAGDKGKIAYDHSQSAHAPSDAVSLTTVKADSDISSAISLKHSHSNKTALDNVSGTNTGDQDLSGKVDKVTGMGLSSNDYTTAEKNKLSGIPTGGIVYIGNLDGGNASSVYGGQYVISGGNA